MTITERHRKLAAEWFRTPGIDSEQESVWVELVARLLADFEREVRLDEARLADKLVKRFIAQRGRHDGEHVMCCDAGRCFDCEAAYIQAEEWFDRAMPERIAGLEGQKGS